MRSHDFIHGDKLEEFLDLCWKAGISVTKESSNVKANGEIRIIGSGTMMDINKYDEILHKVKHGVERPKVVKKEPKKKRWWQRI